MGRRPAGRGWGPHSLIEAAVLHCGWPWKGSSHGRAGQTGPLCTTPVLRMCGRRESCDQAPFSAAGLPWNYSLIPSATVRPLSTLRLPLRTQAKPAGARQLRAL